MKCVYEIITMLGKTRALETIFEDDESECLVQNRKVARLQLQQISEWKIVFELTAEEYLSIQVHAHQALDELFELIFNYKSGSIYYHLAQIAHFDDRNVNPITGLSEEMASRLKMLCECSPSREQVIEVLELFHSIFPNDLIGILQNIAAAFPKESPCLPGAMRLVACLFPLQKYKAFGMLCLALHSILQKGYNYSAEVSEILTGSKHCTHLFYATIAYWDSVFVLHCQ